MNEFINKNYTNERILGRYNHRNIGIEHIKTCKQGKRPAMNFYCVRVPSDMGTNGKSIKKCFSPEEAKEVYMQYMQENCPDLLEKYPCTIFEKKRI